LPEYATGHNIREASFIMQAKMETYQLIVIGEFIEQN